MTPESPADFSPQERQLFQTTLMERYGRVVPTQTVEVELLLNPADKHPSPCTAFYWRDGDAEFVVARVVGAIPGAITYRTQFFYGDDEAFGTGHQDFGNLGDCLVTVLQVQAAHAAERAKTEGTSSTGPLAPQPKITGDEDYNGPLVI